jgi:hypothetical protein
VVTHLGDGALRLVDTICLPMAVTPQNSGPGVSMDVVLITPPNCSLPKLNAGLSLTTTLSGTKDGPGVTDLILAASREVDPNFTRPAQAGSPRRARVTMRDTQTHTHT